MIPIYTNLWTHTQTPVHHQLRTARACSLVG
uniref:Uncharacterized protein n=1 Tax=Arundo donax TaxID=35708 RepID=A0A0A9FTI7_ARUDO